jgi:hypothetical protein
VIIPICQIVAAEPAMDRAPERAQDFERARGRVVGVDVEAQQVVDIEGPQLVGAADRGRARRRAGEWGGITRRVISAPNKKLG